MNVMKWAGLTFTVCLLLSANTHADQALYESRCSSCHGINGQGQSASATPAIAGLDKTYLQRQLQHFKQGIRGNSSADMQSQIMAQMAKPLSTSQIDALADYLSQKPFVNAPLLPSNGGLAGAGLYRNCQSCHGAKAQGSSGMSAPRLAGQHPEYLRRQLANFKDGHRGRHAEDVYGKQMADIAQSLPEAERLEKVLQFISHLGK